MRLLTDFGHHRGINPFFPHLKLAHSNIDSESPAMCIWPCKLRIRAVVVCVTEVVGKSCGLGHQEIAIKSLRVLG